MKIDASLGSAAAVGAAGLVAGTHLRTPAGWRRVEFLRPGDLVMTRDAGLQPVRLVLRRAVSTAEMAADPSLAPVRLAPREIGPMMPRRNLWVGGGQRLLVPSHCVFGAPEATWSLIAAHEIAGTSDGTFVDLSLAEVTYHTPVFDCHQIVQAEGQPLESFLPSAAALRALDEERRGDLLRVFPELRRSPSAYPPALYATATGEDYRPEVG